jgi:FkbH-like protein
LRRRIQTQDSELPVWINPETDEMRRLKLGLMREGKDVSSLTQVGPLARHHEQHLHERGRSKSSSTDGAPAQTPFDSARGVVDWNRLVDPLSLLNALEILKKPVPENVPLRRIFLACGFAPLHLQTFLAARLREAPPQRRIEMKTGLFGDLAGNLERMNPSDFDGVAVVIEWEDLDARLGIRRLGGWGASTLPDVMKSVRQGITRLTQVLRRVAASIPTCVCMPTLPLPPVFTTRTIEASHYEFQLRHAVASFAASTCDQLGIRLVSPQCLDDLSPLGERFDLKSEIMAGFPYKLAHASVVAGLLAVLIRNEAPRKGIITDLDDTLWAGILGEDGAEGISWHLDQHTHMHGLYQQVLESLASTGVLVAAASKNDPALVEQALEREDLLISRESVYPIEAQWAPKSVSVRRILKTWNIGPEGVVFIDDSPMEVAEVKAAFPEMECIVFPQHDDQATWNLLKRLRDLFGKSVTSPEDSIRLKSIRSASALRESLDAPESSLDDFLRSADASVQFTFGKRVEDGRTFELINKTNQFNLNGKRMSEAAWRTYLSDAATFLMTVSYEDKYGFLGRIAVVLGRVESISVHVDFWVMSCRAFSRRIEHLTLKRLFEKFEAQEIWFDYQSTPRNEPLQEFLTELFGVPPTPDLRLSRAAFVEKSPPLFQDVKEIVNA